MQNRSKPLHPTEGPGDGRTWHEFFRTIREDRIAAAAGPDPDSIDDDDLPGTITITEPPHEYTEKLPQGLSTWRNRLLANDYEVKVGRSVAWHADTFWKSGKLRKGAHSESQIWINAWDGVRYVTVSYNFIDGKTVSQNTVRKVSGIGHNLSDAELRELVEW